MTAWMLYGANGYTGQLIIDVAKKKGLSPILAGRNRVAVEKLGAEHELECRVFDLDAIGENLEGVSAVLLAAGPFMFTSAIVAEACIARGIHYLDITGEVTVFEELAALDARAKAAGSVLLPGVGFDVVPSDCLAASLAALMPDATELELAFTGGQFSKGTSKTMLAHIGNGGAIRENGVIRKVPLAYHSKTIAFHDKSRPCTTIPWGDVSTSYYSTGIGNIRVYTKASRARVRQMKGVRYLAPLLKTAFAQKQLGRLIDSKVEGPEESARASMKVELWGRVCNAQGQCLEGTLTTPEGYGLTAACAVESVQRIGEVEPGFRTPSLAFGPSYICEFEGCTLRLPTSAS